jgi:hypothetical protein
MRELERFGFLKRTKTKDKDGKFNDVVYDVYENTTTSPYSGFPYTEKPYTEKPYTENRTQLNTKELNTKELNIKDIYGDSENKNADQSHKSSTKQNQPTRHKYGEYNNVLLTDEQMDKLKAEFPKDWEQRIERLSGYMASTGKSYKNHLVTMRVWAKKETPETVKQPTTEPEEKGEFYSRLGENENLTDEELDIKIAQLEEKLK